MKKMRNASVFLVVLMALVESVPAYAGRNSSASESGATTGPQAKWAKNGCSLKDALQASGYLDVTLSLNEHLKIDLDAMSQSTSIQKDRTGARDAFRAGNHTLIFDASTKRLVAFGTFPFEKEEPRVKVQSTRLDREKAFEIASAFLREQDAFWVVEPSDLTLGKPSASWAGDAGNVWSVHKRFSYQGVPTESFVSLEISENGAVCDFSACPFAEPTSMEVLVERDNAVNAAVEFAKKKGDVRTRVDRAEKEVVYPTDLAERQPGELPSRDFSRMYLCWRVVLIGENDTDDTRSVHVYIDCKTAEVRGGF